MTKINGQGVGLRDVAGPPPPQGKAVGRGGVTGAEARRTAEAAYDTNFAGLPGAKPTTDGAPVPTGDMPPSAASPIGFAVVVLTDLEGKYLTSPPSGPIADGFVGGVPDEPPPAVTVE